MESLFLNPKNFDSVLNIIENFAKEIFSGNDENQKFKLSKKLQNLLDLNHLEKRINSVQNLDINSSGNAGLPDEIWLKIIQYLPTKAVFGNFALTCKKLNNLTQDSSAIKYLKVETINTWPEYESVSKIISNSKALVELKILKCGDFDNELICHALESNPKLRSLSINSKELNEKVINAIIKSKIESLDLDLEKGSDKMTGLGKIKTLKSLRMMPNEEIISTLANKSIAIEEVTFFRFRVKPSTDLNKLFKSKKDTLKKISLILDQYDENVPLKKLNMCQNLEYIVMLKWHANHLEIFSGLPKLKKLVLYQLDAKVDNLVALFRRLSLKKLEHLSIQFCENAREDFFEKLSKLDFPALKSFHIHQSWRVRRTNNETNLIDNALQSLVSRSPNLEFIQFSDNSLKLTFKTLMEIFERRNILMIFGESHSQLSMEEWFMKHDQEIYEKYQKLKYRWIWKLEG